MPGQHHDSFPQGKFVSLGFYDLVFLSLSSKVFCPLDQFLFSFWGHAYFFFCLSSFSSCMSAASSCTFCHESLADRSKFHLPAAHAESSLLQPSLLMPKCLTLICARFHTQSHSNRSDQGFTKPLPSCAMLSYIVYKMYQVFSLFGRKHLRISKNIQHFTETR